MEHPSAAPNDRQYCVPPLLYVPPLRIVAPPGVQPLLPPTFNPQNPFDGFLSSNGFPPDLSRDWMADAETHMPPPRPFSSAASRDSYPPGFLRFPDSNNRKTGARDADHQGMAFPAASACHEFSPIPASTHAPVPPPTPMPSTSTISPAPASSSPSSRKRKKRPPSADKPSKRPPPGSARPSSSPKTAVVETLRLYDAVRRNLLLEDEYKGKEAAKGSRLDLNAGNVLNSNGLAVNRAGKVVGHVPGVEVGDVFYFRMEICCIGLHGPIQAGIEYLTAKESPHSTPVAISIISAGGYDARDDGDELIYTGQGGKARQEHKPTEDQKLERGNLAMEGSMKYQVPVRVIRGIKDSASPSGKTYTYDGLYKVEECWSEKGKFGFEEFKFRLRRLPGQPERGSAVIALSNQLKYKPKTRQGVRLADLSHGKEDVPVCVVNTMDDEDSPPPFEYTTTVLSATFLSNQFIKQQGCDCSGSCELSQVCACFLRNKNAFAYLNNGVLVKERGIVYECGSSCTCSFNCRNRVTQRVPKYRFEVFKTEDRGWGLRSWDIIPAGSFVCEYTGRFVNDMQVLQTRDYVLNLTGMPETNPLWGDVSRYLESHACQVADDMTRPELVMDSNESGNLSRFINHSCSSNLLVQCVVRDQVDGSWPHLMLFAMDNIPPFRELTVDYGFELPNSECQLQGKPCLCKSEGCRKRFGF